MGLPVQSLDDMVFTARSLYDTTSYQDSDISEECTPYKSNADATTSYDGWHILASQTYQLVVS